jgi:hypothetical protein
MIAHHGLKRRCPGHNALGTAAESGKEVRLDESRDNPDISFGNMPVD